MGVLTFLLILAIILIAIDIVAHFIYMQHEKTLEEKIHISNLPAPVTTLSCQYRFKTKYRILVIKGQPQEYIDRMLDKLQEEGWSMKEYNGGPMVVLSKHEKIKDKEL